MVDFVFVILALFAIFGGVGMILFAQPMHSAMSLIVTLLALGGVFSLLSAPFLFMVQIILYAGAIITLLLFIIMFLNIRDDDLPKEPNKIITIIIGAVLMIPLNWVVLKAFDKFSSKSMSILQNEFGSIKSFGMELFRGWLVPFELITMLLLAALVGAVVYARKDKLDG